MINRKVKILLIGSNIWYFGEGMFGPLLAVFAQRIGGNILDITWAWAIYLIISGTFVMIIGKIADQYSREKIMMAGYILNALFTFSYLLVKNPMQLFIVQAGLGLASALAIPTWSALYDINYTKKENKSYVWGLASGQAQIVTGLAVIIGGIISSKFSFSALFLAMGTIQIIAVILQAQILRNKN